MSSAEASRDVLFPVQTPHISLNADEETIRRLLMKEQGVMLRGTREAVKARYKCPGPRTQRQRSENESHIF